MSNKRREQLLNEKAQLYLDEEQSFQGIQMTNFKAYNDANYITLEDQQQYSSPFNQKSINLTKDQAQKITQKFFADQPLVPNTSYNYEPNKIFINGITFVHKNAIKGMMKTSQKPKKPQMQVICQNCCRQQMVPANTSSFICFDCDRVQWCMPQYGIFICGSCERKVWYPLGSSTLIKCMKCGTINNIPITSNLPRDQNEYNARIPEESDQAMTQKYFDQRYKI